MTAKEIAEKHYPAEQALASGLELDILRYLEYHLKKWEAEREGSFECSHVFASVLEGNITSGIRKCVKCGQLEMSTLTSPK